MAKAQPHELSLLHYLGCTYRHFPKRGWYYKDRWIGYNVREAFEWLHQRGIN